MQHVLKILTTKVVLPANCKKWQRETHCQGNTQATRQYVCVCGCVGLVDVVGNERRVGGSGNKAATAAQQLRELETAIYSFRFVAWFYFAYEQIHLVGS